MGFRSGLICYNPLLLNDIFIHLTMAPKITKNKGYKKKSEMRSESQKIRTSKSEIKEFAENSLIFDIFILAWIRNSRFVMVPVENQNGNGGKPKEQPQSVPHTIATVKKQALTDFSDAIHKRTGREGWQGNSIRE